MKVFFLASYPRSGNTWARVLLYHALFGREREAPTTRDIALRLPDLHVDGEVEASLAEHPPGEGGRVIMKTHFPWSPAHAFAAHAAGAILVVRHPRDVLLSSLNFHRVLETKVKDRRTGRDTPLRGLDYAHAFIKSGGDPVWLGQGFDTWIANNRSWMNADLPRLTVRYEEMLDDPARELGRMLDFLGETRDKGVIAHAVAASSFEQMRALEIREKAGETKKSTFFGGSSRTIRQGIYFMDKARRGSSLDPIQPGLDAAFAARFADALGEFGYA